MDDDGDDDGDDKNETSQDQCSRRVKASNE